MNPAKLFTWELSENFKIIFSTKHLLATVCDCSYVKSPINGISNNKLITTGAAKKSTLVWILENYFKTAFIKKMFSFSMDPKVPGKGRCKSEYNNYKDNIAR